jgi:hypothetical protein
MGPSSEELRVRLVEAVNGGMVRAGAAWVFAVSLPTIKR